MGKNKYAIILAGGSGTRMGGAVPKQFIRVDRKTLLQRSIERFVEAEPDIRIVTVLPKAHFQTWRRICTEESFDCPQLLVEGGMNRFLSVRNALAKVPDGALVAIHDGVRPFVSVDLIREMFSRMEGGCRALIPVLPVSDTLRSTEHSVPDPDRSRTVAVQTPQVFASDDIKRAYAQPYDLAFTDDASVASRLGVEVEMISGEKFNIKVTTPEDLVFAEAILSRQRT